MRKAVSIIILVAFISTSVKSPAFAQAILSSDPSIQLMLTKQQGILVHLSPAFSPATLTGIAVHPDNALQFDFIINRGGQVLEGNQRQEEYKKLVKYFLASLTIPDEDQWVNLSPYEKNRIIKDDFGETEMGRDLLAQDYFLKQLTSSLIYPEEGLGKKFWNTVYERAWNEYHTTNIPVNTFNKVWIVPDEAIVYESGNSAFILKSHLRVMLEEDYLSLQKHTAISNRISNDSHAVASQVIREIVLPELEKEVNGGKSFASLRQMYSGMVLATWYKRELKDSLLGRIYADRVKVKGVDQDPKINEIIYQQYLMAFKKGVFNYIKDDAIPGMPSKEQGILPRKYFSGGFVRVNGDKYLRIKDLKNLSEKDRRLVFKALNASKNEDDIVIIIYPAGSQKNVEDVIVGKGVISAIREAMVIKTKGNGSQVTVNIKPTVSEAIKDFWGMIKPKIRLSESKYIQQLLSRTYDYVPVTVSKDKKSLRFETPLSPRIVKSRMDAAMATLQEIRKELEEIRNGKTDRPVLTSQKTKKISMIEIAEKTRAIADELVEYSIENDTYEYKRYLVLLSLVKLSAGEIGQVRAEVQRIIQQWRNYKSDFPLLALIDSFQKDKTEAIAMGLVEYSSQSHRRDNPDSKKQHVLNLLAKLSSSEEINQVNIRVEKIIQDIKQRNDYKDAYLLLNAIKGFYSRVLKAEEGVMTALRRDQVIKIKGDKSSFTFKVTWGVRQAVKDLWTIVTPGVQLSEDNFDAQVATYVQKRLERIYGNSVKVNRDGKVPSFTMTFYASRDPNADAAMVVTNKTSKDKSMAALSVLSEVLNGSKNWHERLEAVKEISFSGDPQALTVLINALPKENNSYVRIEIMQGMGLLDPKGKIIVKDLENVIETTKNTYSLGKAFELLTRLNISKEQIKEIVIKRIYDPDVNIRLVALKVLVKSGYKYITQERSEEPIDKRVLIEGLTEYSIYVAKFVRSRIEENRPFKANDIIQRYSALWTKIDIKKSIDFECRALVRLGLLTQSRPIDKEEITWTFDPTQKNIDLLNKRVPTTEDKAMNAKLDKAMVTNLGNDLVGGDDDIKTLAEQMMERKEDVKAVFNGVELRKINGTTVEGIIAQYQYGIKHKVSNTIKIIKLKPIEGTVQEAIEIMKKEYDKKGETVQLLFSGVLLEFNGSESSEQIYKKYRKEKEKRQQTPLKKKERKKKQPVSDKTKVINTIQIKSGKTSFDLAKREGAMLRAQEFGLQNADKILEWEKEGAKRWKNVLLLTPEQFKALPNGVFLKSISDKYYIKGRGHIDTKATALGVIGVGIDLSKLVKLEIDRDNAMNAQLDKAMATNLVEDLGEKGSDIKIRYKFSKTIGVITLGPYKRTVQEAIEIMKKEHDKMGKTMRLTFNDVLLEFNGSKSPEEIYKKYSEEKEYPQQRSLKQQRRKSKPSVSNKTRAIDTIEVEAGENPFDLAQRMVAKYKETGKGVRATFYGVPLQATGGDSPADIVLQYVEKRTPLQVRQGRNKEEEMLRAQEFGLENAHKISEWEQGGAKLWKNILFLTPQQFKALPNWVFLKSPMAKYYIKGHDFIDTSQTTEGVIPFGIDLSKYPKIEDVLSTTDRAMNAKGGIDFNSANLNMQIKRDGKGVALPWVQQDMAQWESIEGFVPVIISIKPAMNVPILKELQQELHV